MAADPLAAIGMALAEIGIASAALDRLGRALTELRQAQLDSRLSSLPPCDVPVTEHRREHRAGRVPKIDADPALPAFILARLDRLTITRSLPRSQRTSRRKATSTPPQSTAGHSATGHPRRSATFSDRRETRVGLRRSNPLSRRYQTC